MDEPEKTGTEEKQKPRGRLARALDLLLWAAVAGVIVWRFGPQVAAMVDVGGREGQSAPRMAVGTLDGGSLALDTLRGKVVVVNFWATWCPPCRYETPGFQQVWEERRGDGLVVVGLSRDRGSTGEVRDWLAREGVTYPVAIASDEVAQSFGGIRGLPTTLLIDRQGRIRHRVTGYFAEPALRAAVGRLLKEPAPDLPARAQTAR